MKIIRNPGEVSVNQDAMKGTPGSADAIISRDGQIHGRAPVIPPQPHELQTPVEAKILEVRDTATCIPILAVRFEVTPEELDSPDESINRGARLIRRAGWGLCDPITLVTRLVDAGEHGWMSLHDYYILQPGETMRVAYGELYLNWDKYSTGDVIECGLISGRVSTPQGSDL